MLRASLRPPLKPSVQISRTGLSQRCASQHLANEGISEIRFTMSFTPLGGQIVKENCDHWPRIGSVTENPRSNAV